MCKGDVFFGYAALRLARGDQIFDCSGPAEGLVTLGGYKGFSFLNSWKCGQRVGQEDLDIERACAAICLSRLGDLSYCLLGCGRSSRVCNHR